MFFFNGRIRHPYIVPIIVSGQTYSNKVSHSCMIAGCLTLIIGLCLIITGITSETKKTIFIGIGIISLGIGLFLTTLVCFYTKLDICYHNWAYGQTVGPLNMEERSPATESTISMTPFAESLSISQQIKSTIPMATVAPPMTVMSDFEINKVVIAQSIKIDKTKTSKDNPL